ncbi:hypothetical protein MJO29_004966 [Puccinia striiformis f. sp. tritici]|uniref:Transmembrane protein 188 n=2 Tax=Puccinia striiformis TaxID=27350 RepID=A0A2S4VXM4_9BASI|nr:uncharacterized protein Pst134EA_031653 [Puccinia striiformis f. sp. tritici]XP_047808010.1 hypothetical protein Pst134EA_009094 [Puccinia striiformis f. sp. tritici]POW14285.1 hypothetical protein PSTT_03060 [Puccinia striiformis]KAH9442684.1 hypothetical protein Pst134EA_031653 [Puccinia striiformis f. sp. tritici]KAH9468556.1 hypothetical protein Pst134EA_009094 [Puccinia striiformis f. sp. tritici]KAI7959898.1 hypothetical protein MJO29_004966 [Puccinia striiformis f. sp. tritici]POW20
MTSTINFATSSADGAFPTPAPLKFSGRTETGHEGVDDLVTTISYVTVVEKTVVFATPTAIAQSIAVTRYSPMARPETWAPLVVFVIVFIAGSMVFGWITYTGRLQKFFKTKPFVRKLRTKRGNHSSVTLQSSSQPIGCANAKSLDFQNFVINNRPRPPPPLPTGQRNLRDKKVEMTLLILEGKVARPPPSPFKPLPPGMI